MLREIVNKVQRLRVLCKHDAFCSLKGIEEINCWHVLAYLKGIQDVGVFVSTVSILIFFRSNRCCLSVI